MIAKVRKAVFPAAGLGTRFLPATKAQPKEMLPIVDKPLIQYGVEEAMHSGIRNIIIVTGRGKSSIEDHFDVSFELEQLLESKNKSEMLSMVRSISDMIDISYVRQKEALGLGHAVLRAKELVGTEPFAVVLSDDIIASENPCVRQLLEIYEYYGASVLALMEVPGDQISAYGV
ncbi:MAG: UTP--glucose-1-phosphate uridylyltransferase, partial [Acidobacteriaceae bacterium]|nr:UTP--glucose-1-phosphate uridylyltransferase [Acidobacteriaceae bacterium]